MAENSKKYVVLKFIEGVGLALILCLISILILAFISKTATLGVTAIKLICVFIKMFAVFVACLFGVRGKRLIIKGILMGFAVIAVTYLLFGIISGNNTLDYKCLLDLLFGGIAGIFGGGFVKLKKS